MTNRSGCGEWYHETGMNKFFEMKSITCNGKALFAENKLSEEDLCGDTTFSKT